MITSIDINSFSDEKVVFTESFLNRSTYLLDFFKKWLGIIGWYVVFIVIMPFVALLLFGSGFYFRKMAKKISALKPAILKEMSNYSYSDIKILQKTISPTSYQFQNLYEKLLLLKGDIFFKRLYNPVSSIHFDIVAINEALANRYTISANELSAEQLEAVTSYWDRFKKNKPEAYKILSADKSGEEIVFNSKKSN